MAVTCPIDLDVASLRAEVQTMYSRVATSPDGEFHFHRGPHYAATMLGYNATELAALPAEVTSSFAGIGNPHALGRIPAGATVLDIGCGAGTDLLLAARQVGPTGRAIGVDMTEAMRERASKGAAACGLGNVEVRPGDATRLPVEDQKCRCRDLERCPQPRAREGTSGCGNRPRPQARRSRADCRHHHRRGPTRQRAARH